MDLGTHQVVSEHSILGAHMDTRYKRMESGTEELEHRLEGVSAKLKEIERLWKRRKQEETRRRTRRHHVSSQRSGSSTESKTLKRDEKPIKVEELAAVEKMRDPEPRQQRYTEEEISKPKAEKENDANESKTHFTEGRTEKEETDWDGGEVYLAIDKEPLLSTESLPLLMSPLSPESSPPSPEPWLPADEATMVEWKPVHNRGEMSLSLGVKICKRKEKKKKVSGDLHVRPPEPPEPPDRRLFAAAVWKSNGGDERFWFAVAEDERSVSKRKTTNNLAQTNKGKLLQEERKRGQPHFISRVETLRERTTGNLGHKEEEPTWYSKEAILEAVGLQLRCVSSTLVPDVQCWFSEWCSWPLICAYSFGGDNLKGYYPKNARAIIFYMNEAIIVEYLEAMVPETSKSVQVLVLLSSSSYWDVSFLDSVSRLLKPIISNSLSKISHDESKIEQKSEGNQKPNYFEDTSVRIGRRWSLSLITNSYVPFDLAPRSGYNFYFQVSKANLMVFAPTLNVEIVLQVKLENNDETVIMDGLICFICSQSKSNSSVPSIVGHISRVVKLINLLVGVGRSCSSGLVQLKNIANMVELLFVHKWNPSVLTQSKSMQESATCALKYHGCQTHQHNALAEVLKTSIHPMLLLDSIHDMEEVIEPQEGIHISYYVQRESSRISLAETQHIQWEPGGNYYSSIICLALSLCFVLWDPGGRVLIVVFMSSP